MTSEKSLIVFQDKKIRRLCHYDEWFYSVSDIIAILTEGKKYETDCVNIESMLRIIQSILSLKKLTQELMERLTQDYWYILKKREAESNGIELSKFCRRLKLSFNLSFRLSFLNLKEILTW
jgi:hypothetical protein